MGSFNYTEKETRSNIKETKKKMYRGIIIIFFLSCISLPFGAANPRRKSYVTINESEAHLVQENIDYEKIATITTPKNLDVEYTKADMADPRKITLEDPLDLNNRNVASAKDFFDNAAPTLIENHIRRKRQTRLTCEMLNPEMFGAARDRCCEIVEPKCGGHAIHISTILYDCQRVQHTHNTLVIPCAVVTARGVQVNADNTNFCLLHMHTSGSNDRWGRCTACSNDPACRGADITI